MHSCPSDSYVFRNTRGKHYFYTLNDDKIYCLPTAGKKAAAGSETTETKPEVIFRQLNQSEPQIGDIADMRLKLSGTEKRLTISTFLPNAIEIGLEWADPGSYILCPVYSDGDLQVGITGKAHVTENINDAATREVAEEIGAIPQDIFRYHIGLIDKFNLFVFPFSDTINVDDHPAPPSGTDSRTRVAIVLHADYDDVYDFLSQPKVKLWPSTDNIVGVCALDINLAREIVDVLDE